MLRSHQRRSSRRQLVGSVLFVVFAFLLAAGLPLLFHAGLRAAGRDLTAHAPQRTSEFLAPDAHLAVAVAELAVRLAPGVFEPPTTE